MAEEGTLDELRALGHQPMTPMQAIRAHCIDCAGRLGLGGGQMRRAEVPELAIPAAALGGAPGGAAGGRLRDPDFATARLF